MKKNAYSIVDKTREKFLEYERREQEILDAAIRLFNDRGYKATTTAAIAKAAHISEPTLYKHFRNKKALFLACFHSITDVLLEQYRAVYRQHRDSELDFLKGVTRVYVEFVINNPGRSMFLIQLMSYRKDADFEKTFTDFMELSIQTVQRVLNRAKEKGKLDADIDTRFLAAAFVAQYFTVVAMTDFIDPAAFTSETHFRLFESLVKTP